MRSNRETDYLHFRTDEEFRRQLNESSPQYHGQIRNIPRIIQNIPSDCWFVLKAILSFLKDLFLKQYIALTLLFSSAFTSVAVVILLTNQESLIIVVYCASLFICSVVSIAFSKGTVEYSFRRKLEQQYLLEHNNLQQYIRNRDRLNVHQPPGDVAEGEMQPLQRYARSLMDPRQESEAAFTPGETTDVFLEQNPSFECYSTDPDEPARGPFQACISADSIMSFGPPIQVFGADSYKIITSSNETIATIHPDIGPFELCKNAPEVRTFESSVEVHHPDTYRPFSSVNENSTSDKLAALERDESLRQDSSGSSSNLSHTNDDQSSNSACVTFLD